MEHKTSAHLFIKLQSAMNELDKITRGCNIPDRAIELSEQIHGLSGELQQTLKAEKLAAEAHG